MISETDTHLLLLWLDSRADEESRAAGELAAEDCSHTSLIATGASLAFREAAERVRRMIGAKGDLTCSGAQKRKG